MLVDEGQHRLHDPHRVHSQLLPLFPRPCRRRGFRPQGDLPREAFRLLVRLRPVQMGEMRREEDAQAVHQQHRLPAASGVGHVSYGNSTAAPSRGGGICVYKYDYF